MMLPRSQVTFHELSQRCITSGLMTTLLSSSTSTSHCTDKCFWKCSWELGIQVAQWCHMQFKSHFTSSQTAHKLLTNCSQSLRQTHANRPHYELARSCHWLAAGEWTALVSGPLGVPWLSSTSQIDMSRCHVWLENKRVFSLWALDGDSYVATTRLVEFCHGPSIRLHGKSFGLLAIVSCSLLWAYSWSANCHVSVCVYKHTFVVCYEQW